MKRHAEKIFLVFTNRTLVCLFFYVSFWVLSQKRTVGPGRQSIVFFKLLLNEMWVTFKSPDIQNMTFVKPNTVLAFHIIIDNFTYFTYLPLKGYLSWNLMSLFFLFAFVNKNNTEKVLGRKRNRSLLAGHPCAATCRWEVSCL